MCVLCALGSDGDGETCRGGRGGIGWSDSNHKRGNNKRGGVDGRVRIRSEPGNRTLPLTISARMQPTDHTSTGEEREGKRDEEEEGKAGR